MRIRRRGASYIAAQRTRDRYFSADQPFNQTVAFLCSIFEPSSFFANFFYTHLACIGNGKLYSSTSSWTLSRSPAEGSPRRPLRASGQFAPIREQRPKTSRDLQAYQVIRRLLTGETTDTGYRSCTSAHNQVPRPRRLPRGRAREVRRDVSTAEQSCCCAP